MTWLRHFSIAAMIAVLYVAYDAITGTVTAETWISAIVFLAIGALVATGVAAFERRSRSQ